MNGVIADSGYYISPVLSLAITWNNANQSSIGHIKTNCSKIMKQVHFLPEFPIINFSIHAYPTSMQHIVIFCFASNIIWNSFCNNIHMDPLSPIYHSMRMKHGSCLEYITQQNKQTLVAPKCSSVDKKVKLLMEMYSFILISHVRRSVEICQWQSGHVICLDV